MSTVEDFVAELLAQIQRASQQGRPHVELNAGEIHRIVGGYPSSSHLMPTCCLAMRKIMHSGDEVVFEPQSGNGASLTIKYRLPR
jgi:5-methylcytosine-specific restriction protein A